MLGQQHPALHRCPGGQHRTAHGRQAREPRQRWFVERDRQQTHARSEKAGVSHNPAGG